MVTDQGNQLRVRAIAAVVIGLGGFFATWGMIEAGWGPLLDLDRSLAAGMAAYAGRHSAYADTLRVVDLVTDPLVFLAIVAVVAVVLYRNGLRRVVLWLVATAVGGWGVLMLAKWLIDRPRPADADPLVGLDAYSFPSGHAFMSMLVLTMLLFVGVRRWPSWRSLAIQFTGRTVLVVIIALDRIALPAHYLTDVFAGWFLALAVLGASRLVLGLTRPANLAVVDRGIDRHPRLGVVLNPSKLDDVDGFRGMVTRLARQHGWQEPRWFDTTVHDAGRAMSRAALEADVDLVLAAGGDGTVRVVCSELAGSDVPVGVVPIGTGNLLARNLGIPLDYEDAVEVGLAGADRRIDLVAVDGDGLTTDHFAVMAGLGLDAAVMGGAPEPLKASVGWAAYVVSIAKNVAFPPTRMWISVDGGPPMREKAIMVVIGNVGTLSGGFPLLPDAAPDDGYVDVVLVAPRRAADWPRIAWHVVRRTRDGSEQLRYFRGREIVIRAEQSCPRQLDGDVVASGQELRTRVLPKALVLRVPRERGHARD